MGHRRSNYGLGRNRNLLRTCVGGAAPLNVCARSRRSGPRFEHELAGGATSFHNAVRFRRSFERQPVGNLDTNALAENEAGGRVERLLRLFGPGIEPMADVVTDHGLVQRHQALRHQGRAFAAGRAIDHEPPEGSKRCQGLIEA